MKYAKTPPFLIILFIKTEKSCLNFIKTNLPKLLDTKNRNQIQVQNNDDTKASFTSFQANILTCWNKLNIFDRTQLLLAVYKIYYGIEISSYFHTKVSFMFNEFWDRRLDQACENDDKENQNQYTSKPQKTSSIFRKSKKDPKEPKNNSTESLLMILDSDLFLLPLEKSKFLKNNFKIITRMTSIQETLLKNSNSDQNSSYSIKDMHCYIPKTDKSLIKTIERIENWINKPSNYLKRSDDIFDSLKNNKPLLYCGHGAGTNYCKKDQMQGSASESISSSVTSTNSASDTNTQSQNLSGLPILMGCSSARFSDNNFIHLKSKKSNPYSAAVKYFENGCSAICGFLWSITDRDTDIFTTQYIDSINEKLGITGSKSGGQVQSKISPVEISVLEEACAIQRLKHMNGYGFVMFGLPEVNLCV